MRRLFLLIFLSLFVIGLAGCGGNSTTPTRTDNTPLPDVTTLVAETLVALTNNHTGWLPIQLWHIYAYYTDVHQHHYSDGDSPK